MKTTRPVRNWAYKGGWLFSIGFAIIILSAISMGKMKVAAAQTEPESTGSVLFDKTTDTIESYTDIPYTDKIDSPSYISYIYSTNDVVPKTSDNEIIELRESNMEVFDLPDGKRQYKFYPSDQYIMKNDGNWYQLEYGTSTIEKFYNEIYFEKEVSKWFIKSANAQTYSGSGDGYIRNSGNTYATVRSATEGNANNYVNAALSAQNTKSGATYYIDRLFLPFNTEALSDTDCIDEVTLDVDVHYIEGGGDSGVLVSANQAATNQLENGDFDQVGSTALAPELDFTATGNYQFVLTNFTNISTSTWTKLAIRADGDVDNTEPGAQQFFQISLSETSGTADDPYLTVTMSSCEGEEEEEETSTSTPFSVEGLNYSWDLTIIAGLTEHYESTTTAPDWVEVSYYHIPFIAWLILFVLLVFIFSRIIIELLIRWRTK